MMNGISLSNDIFNAEQKKLREDIENIEKECQVTQNAVKSIISAAIHSNDSSVRSDNEDESNITVIDISKDDEDDDRMSLESIQAIVTDDEDCQSEEYKKVDDFPGLKELLNLMSQGKLQLSDEVLKKLNELAIKSDVLSKTLGEMQDRWQQLSSSVKEQGKRIESIDQYLKFDNLLLHKFPVPPTKLNSLQFCQYVAELINFFLPHLPVPVHWSHISDAHPLKTKSKKSNVIIVRFSNRNIRHMIYDNRCYLTRRGLAITEHLTESNLDILKKAKELFGFHNAHTDRCNIMVDVNGKSNKVNTIIDVYELFETITINDSLDSSNTTSPSNQAIGHTLNNRNITAYKSSTYASATRNFSNNNNTINTHNNSRYSVPNRNRYRGRGRGHRGERSGYSVRNRSY